MITDSVRLKFDILPPAQRALWPQFSQLSDPWVLYGGTALALRLGHRESIDFDFFTFRSFDAGALMEQLPFQDEAVVVQREQNTLTLSVGRDAPVKVSFFGVPKLGQVREPEVDAESGIRIASWLDLAGTNAATVQVRAEAKDYIDIDALIESGVGLDWACAAALAIYGPSAHPLGTLKALSYFEDGNLAKVSESTRRRLAAAAREVDPLSLPSVGSVYRRRNDE